MKYFLSIFFLSLSLNILSAQEKHFVFIQSDTKQPFYVSVSGKLYSSSANGYVIIPKLADGSYNFTVGFAQNAYPEQTFSCVVQNKDLGFDLKNFNEKGWGLFNLQSLDITMASAANSNVVAKALSESANVNAPAPVISFEKKKDTTQSQNKVSDVAVNSPAKSEDAKDAVPKADSTSLAYNKTTTDTPPASTPIKSGAEPVKTEKPSDVKKVSEVTGEEGVHLSYVEGTGKTRDTINVIIPSSPTAANSSNSVPIGTTDSTSKNSAEAANQSASTSSSSGAKDNLKFLDLKMDVKKDSGQAPETAKESARIMENSNCKNIATDDDYAKLRKKMATETTDEKMISEAKKFYRNKCFTTSQIKGLSTLFLSDEGRFKFFDASFVSVADASQYSTLQTEFIDPAFASRFKSLIQ